MTGDAGPLGAAVDHESDDIPTVPSGVWCETDSARAAIAAAIATSVDRLEAELPRARLGEDPEGVHQARVATRRLRSDLRTFGPLLDGGWKDRIRSDLKRLADALGEVRDADVLQIRLQEAIDAIGVDSNAAARVLVPLQAQAASARRSLVAVIDDEGTEQLVAELRTAATDPPTTPSALGRAEVRLRPLVRRPWRKLARSVAELPDDPSVARLHRIRLLAKRARYSAEAVVDVYGRDARRFAKAVSRVQDVLGDMHDAEVAAAWLRQAAGELDPDAAFVAGRLAQHYAELSDVERHGWQRHFRRARKRSGWLR